MTATPGQAALQPGEIVYLYHWRFASGEEFGLYRHAEDAEAKAAEHVSEGLSEVLSMAVLDRPQVVAAQEPHAAPELAAADERVALRALISELNRLVRGWRETVSELEEHSPMASDETAERETLLEVIRQVRSAAQPVPEDIPAGIMPSGGERNAQELLDARRTCGHKYKLGGGIYICEREPHPTDGYGPAFRHASYGRAVTPENGKPDGE